jgi:hypothetical protein
MNKKEKMIISVIGNCNTGKACTLRKFRDLLKEKSKNYSNFEIVYEYPDPITQEDEYNNPDKDFSIVVKIENIVIGIHSAGDPGSDLEEYLVNLADNYNCDIIFCACRLPKIRIGSTKKAVINMMAKGYTVNEGNWIKTEKIDSDDEVKRDKERLNTINKNAEKLLEVLIDFINKRAIK